MVNNQAQKDQEKKFLEAYDACADALFRHCYYRVYDRDKAKDLVQEAFCKTWEYITKKGNTVLNMKAFLYRTTNNLIIDDSRKKKSVSLNQIMEKGFSPHVDPKNNAESFFVTKELVNIIHSLDDKYKEVIMMKYLDDLSPKEISSITGHSENNIQVRIHRGLEKIKKILRSKD